MLKIEGDWRWLCPEHSDVWYQSESPVYAEWLGRLNDFRRRTERDYCRRCGAGKLVLDECGVCDVMRRRDPEFVDWLLKVISNTVWSRRY
jgi:hypothetical protein